ncbi:MAG: TetR/AcrR family transcriptional regulator, transcriptional repressor for nem operon [Acetobacteraceae bacterium]|jgi:TetR/AcrR family transcriptional repressor of nem operon|nr:TetR/AcrR family transcriptional regulator, transcriptional repressor for nem operon [Acetobacteraceae bacterium]
MARPTAAFADTPTLILDVAERLVQTGGFNGFSYADIASELGVTKASLHYHFATKAELGGQLIARYRSAFLAALERINNDSADAMAKLNAYAGIYADVLAHDRMCLCGMLAAEYATLPDAMQDGIRRFFDANEAWLIEVLASGRKKRQIAFEGPPVDVARVIVALLEGGVLVARSRRDAGQFRTVARRMLSDLKVKAIAARCRTPPRPVNDAGLLAGSGVR